MKSLKTKLFLSVLVLSGSVLVMVLHAVISIAEVDSWEYKVIDASNNGRVAVGDFDGDGKNDIAVHTWGSNRGETADGTLVWYKYPDWTKSVIKSNQNFFGDEIKTADLDSDGDMDVVVPVGSDSRSDIYWYENLGNGSSWQERFIGNVDGISAIKDIHIHDMDKDGMLDIVTRTKTNAAIFYQNSKTSWNKTSTGIAQREGSAIGDVDRDGYYDFILNGYWLKNPKARSNGWSRYDIDSIWYNHAHPPGTENWRDFSVKAQFADMNGDGKGNIIFSHSEHSGFQVTWYESNNPTGGVGAWTKHEMGIVDYCHTLQAADFDLDGDIDILAGSTKWRTAGGQIIIFYNDGSGTFTKKIIDNKYMYTGIIGDIDNDGDMDIVNTRSWEDNPIEMWRNNKISSGGGFNYSYKEVDNDRDKYGILWYNYFGIYMDDATGDGYDDIVSGKYFYRNPGGDMMGEWPSYTFPVNSDGALIADIDGDQYGDVIAFALPDVYWFEATNLDGSSWTQRKKIALPPNTITQHKNPQNAHLADLTGDGKLEIIFEAGKEDVNAAGVYALQIPSNPLTESWPLTRLTSSGGDGIGIGDIDKDGDLDITIGQQNVKWYENPGSLKLWTGYNVGDTDIAADRFAIADIDGDGRKDIIVSEETWPKSDDYPTNCYWFKNPSNPKSGSWTRNYVARGYHGLQSMEPADMDNDGDIDIVLGEHLMAERMFIFENDGSGNFVEHEIGRGKESHGLFVKDIDNDGDKDIAHISWFDYQHVHLWINGGGGPPPPPPPLPPFVDSGIIYKEFIFNNNNNNWRVTDPGATNPGAAAFLPNPKLNLSVDDLSDATKAELVIDFWGGHDGTTGKKLRFNSNAWINIPELHEIGPCPLPGNKYMQQVNYKIDIPLSHLKTGLNIFEGTSGPNSWGWGQWGWYGTVLRVYYNSSKPHATGQIAYPLSNSTIVDFSTISVSTSEDAARVDVFAYYDGYDTDGDGIYKDWQGNYHKYSWAEQLDIKNHIGTDTSDPFQIKWDTGWVPDQTAGSIKIKARVKDANGYWYETVETTNLTLQRTGYSVKIHKPYNVPELFWVRADRTKSSKVDIPSLSDATEAKMFIKTWNGNDGSNEFYTKINSWITPKYGKDHFYHYDQIAVPLLSLKTGENIITFNSTTVHHGIEILWPGPGIVVKYGADPDPDPPVPIPPGPIPPGPTPDTCESKGNQCCNSCHTGPHPGYDSTCPIGQVCCEHCSSGLPPLPSTCEGEGYHCCSSSCKIDAPPKYNSDCASGICCAVCPSAIPPPLGEVGIKNFIKTADFSKIIENALMWLLSIVGSLALLILITGGVMYISSAGDEQKVLTAKKIVTYAVIGLILILLSYSIIKVLSGMLT